MQTQMHSRDYNRGYEAACDDELSGWVPEKAQTITSIIAEVKARSGENSRDYWAGYTAALREEFDYPL